MDRAVHSFPTSVNTSWNGVLSRSPSIRLRYPRARDIPLSIIERLIERRFSSRGTALSRSRNGTLDALKSTAEQEKQNEIHGHPGGRKVDLISLRARQTSGSSNSSSTRNRVDSNRVHEFARQMRPRICINIIQFVNLTSPHVLRGSLNLRTSVIFEHCFTRERRFNPLDACLRHVEKFRRINEYVIVSIYNNDEE